MGATQRERIFMTGANGFVGSVISTFAIAEGYEVHALSRTEKSDARLASMGATPIRGDLHSLDVLRRESGHAQIVMHLADAFLGDFSMAYDKVVAIDAAAVDAMGDALQGTDKRLIVTSGTLVVSPNSNGDETTETSPIDPKPVNDRIKCEQHALSLCGKGILVCAIRLAPFVYGRGGSGVRLFMQMAVANGEVTYINNGETHTSAIHVDDAARLYLVAAKKAKAGDIFNATSQTDVTIRQLCEAMGAILKFPVRSITREDMVAKYGDFLANFLSASNRSSSAKARRELEWQPRELGIVEDIKTGSYPVVADELHRAKADEAPKSGA